MPTPRVVLYIAMSLDGYIATKTGDVSYLNPYSDALAGFGEFQASIGASIMGRMTWEFVRQFMPPGPSTQATYVLTSRPLTDAPSGVHACLGDPGAVVARARREMPPGSARDIWLVGGGQTATAFHAGGLIDLYRLFILPVTLGDGLRLFNPSATAVASPLKLTRSHVFSSGVVEVVYER